MKQKKLALFLVFALALPFAAACTRTETPPPAAETPAPVETPDPTPVSPEVIPYVFVFPNSSEQRLDEWTVYDYALEDLELGQAEILARHCHIFQDEDLAKLFLHQDWYEERQRVTLTDLNDVEFYNHQLMELAIVLQDYRYFEEANNDFERFPAGTPLTVDLNDDGTDETVLLETDGRSYTLTVNNLVIESLYADAVAEYFLLVRLTESPEYTIVLRDDGPSSDYTSSFFRFDGEALIPLGTLEGLVEEDLVVTGEGTLRGYIRSAVLQTWWFHADYVLEDNKIVWEERDVYNTNWYLMVTKEFPLFSDAALTQSAVPLSPGTIVHLTGTNNTSNIRLETLDGREGWFGITGFHQILGTDETADHFFVGLNYAD